MFIAELRVQRNLPAEFLLESSTRGDLLLGSLGECAREAKEEK
jgi:hypothetical protein